MVFFFPDLGLFVYSVVISIHQEEEEEEEGEETIAWETRPSRTASDPATVLEPCHGFTMYSEHDNSLSKHRGEVMLIVIYV